ncbi:MAG TPA: hypothetical protein DD727_01155 [Clostridiales bacterium]|nr:hypothetical protein [Clostridiales bacterium]
MTGREHRENLLRAMEFYYPEWIPCRVSIPARYWAEERERCTRLVQNHPRIFPNQNIEEYGHIHPRATKGILRDSWGCVWRNEQDGIIGQVAESPLDDWDKLKTYSPPDPLKDGVFGERNWEAVALRFKAMKERGEFTEGDGENLFDRLYALRGFENLMMDIALDDPHLPVLVDMLREYELKLVDKWLEIGVDRMYFHTDIGTQQSLMIHPDQFRKYLKPLFRELFQKCRNAGTHVRLSSDGVLLPIVDDLIECGISMHDPQFRANGLERIAKYYRGKICIELDLDRQMFPFCTPDDILRHVR